MPKYKMTITLRGEVTMTIKAEDESEAVIEAEDLFLKTTLPLQLRKYTAALEVEDVDIDEVEEV